MYVDDDVMKNVQIKDHFMEVSSKMVKKEAEESAEMTNSAVTTHSLPLPPSPPEPTRPEETETLRSTVRYNWQSKLYLFGLVYLVMPVE
jgi:hypothetical protein